LTRILLQLFSHNDVSRAIRDALLNGRIEMDILRVETKALGGRRQGRQWDVTDDFSWQTAPAAFQ
jgi:hypothetical protein